MKAAECSIIKLIVGLGIRCFGMSCAVAQDLVICAKAPLAFGHWVLCQEKRGYVIALNI